jgi:hypothetical protein
LSALEAQRDQSLAELAGLEQKKLEEIERFDTLTTRKNALQEQLANILTEQESLTTQRD